MKKILYMLAVAALAAGACCSCDDDDKGDKTPEYIEVSGTATSITATVNSKGVNGYRCTVAEVATIQGFSEMMEQTDIKSMAQFLNDAPDQTTVKALAFAKEGSAFWGTQGGKDIKAATKYYIMTVDLEIDPVTEKPVFKAEDIQFVEYSTPAK